MTYQQRLAVAQILSTGLVFLVYAVHVSGHLSAGDFDGAEGAQLMGRAVLVFIAASVVVNIVVAILFSIGHAIVTGDEDPEFVSDERDRQFEARGDKINMVIGGIGLVAGMAALALGWALFWVIHLIVAGQVLGSIAGNGWRLRLYARGA